MLVYLVQITYKVQDNEVMLADRQVTTVLLFDQPFALGACRMAYHAICQKDGQRCATLAHSTLHSEQHLCSTCCV